MPDEPEKKELGRGHGGTRQGAGRPRRYSFWDMMQVGQACDDGFICAIKAAQKAHLAAMPHADEIRRLHEATRHIPLAQRRNWLRGENYEDHRGDLESLLHQRAVTPIDPNTDTFAAPPSRLITLPQKPPRGTRKRIISEIAARFGLSETATDNIWQEYRRFMHSLADDVKLEF